MMLQEPTLEERIAEIVKVRYKDATDEHRAHVTQRMSSILRQAPDPATVNRFVNQLDLSFTYVQSFVHPYDLRALGDDGALPLPSPLKTRQLDLELAWVEAYYREGLAARPLDDRGRESITRQLDGLISQVRDVMTSKIVGPFATQAIDERLANMRHHLVGTFDSSVSANFPRALSTSEVEGLMSQVRRLSEEMAEIQVDESLASLRPGVGQSDDEKTKARLLRHNEIANAIGTLSQPLYDIFDLWGPERARIRKELERLRSEVQAWRAETYKEMKRLAREGAAPAEPAKPPLAARVPTPAPASPTKPKPDNSPKIPAPASPQDGGRFPWMWIGIAVAFALVAGAALRRRSARSVDRG